jgi:alkylation response protein AidB-like acyl-CoA dehydrogenase
MSEKMWGDEPFWGLGYDWDPDWILTDRQKELRETLISLCEKEMRANAKRSDDELLFPRRNLELLGEHGFLALTVPEEYGGLGENHVAFAMTCETIARYGCASTAMCYVMHMGAVAALMLRPTPELIDKYIRPLNNGLIGTLSYSDPETGSHFWYPVSSRAERQLQDQQEGVVDDVRRLRGLLRPADDEPGLQGLRRPLGLRRRQGVL